MNSVQFSIKLQRCGCGRTVYGTIRYVARPFRVSVRSGSIARMTLFFPFSSFFFLFFFFYNRTKRSCAGSDKIEVEGGRFLLRRSVNIDRDAETPENACEIDFVREESSSRTTGAIRPRKKLRNDGRSETICPRSLSLRAGRPFCAGYIYAPRALFLPRQPPRPLPALCSTPVGRLARRVSPRTAG